MKIWTLTLLVCAALSSFAQNDLSTLQEYMSGEFNSAEQAAADSNYMDISLTMIPIWEASESEAWLYVEQAASAKKKAPYRQRIYQLQKIGANTYVSVVYKIPNQEKFVNAEAKDFEGVYVDELELLVGCSIHLAFIDGEFVGSTKDKDCINAWGEATYATSEVTINSEGMVSWDRGWNDQDEQVWGAVEGGYHFKKQ